MTLAEGTCAADILSHGIRYGWQRQTALLHYALTLWGAEEMWPFTRDKLVAPEPAECLPGRAEAMPAAGRHFVNGDALAGPYPAGLEKAIFGLGCFWGAERVFWQTPGV